MPFKDTPDGSTHSHGDSCVPPHTQKCPDCLAHYTGEHTCDGMMKMIVGESKKIKP